MAVEPLWCGHTIPVIGITGEYASGKTLWALSVDPGCWTEDYSQPATTLVWDTEGSATTYHLDDGMTRRENGQGLHFDHRNLSEMMLRDFPQGHKPVDLFLLWLRDMRAIPSGRYRVLALDTVSEIEDGIADWVNANPQEFGHSVAQYKKMEGLYWGDVKSYWKRLLSEVMARCECLVFTSHMGDVWKGNAPVGGQRKPKGKKTLMELASLYLQLDRKAKPGAPKAPTKPSGIVLDKMRLVHFDHKTREMRPILPPRLPDATPDGVRAYLREPADYGKLKAGERAVEQTMTDDERLSMQAGIAENQATAATAELSRVEMMKRSAAEQAKAMREQAAAIPQQPQPQPQPQPTEHRPAAPATALQTEPQTTPPVYSESTSTRCTEEQKQQIVGLFKEIGVSPEFAQEVVRANGAGVATRLSDLTWDQAAGLITKLVAQAIRLEELPGDEIPF